MSDYAELAVTTNFSFLRGASHPEELVEQAAALGLAAIGIADRNSFAGVVRAHVIAKQRGVRLLTGVRLVTMDGFEVIAYPSDRAAYGRLCRLLTRGNRRAKKGACHLTLDDILEFREGQIFIALAPHASEGSIPSPSWPATEPATHLARVGAPKISIARRRSRDGWPGQARP